MLSIQRWLWLYNVVKGVADDSGAIGFLSWEPFEHEIGSLLKIENTKLGYSEILLKSILVLPKLRYSMIQISIAEDLLLAQ